MEKIIKNGLRDCTVNLDGSECIIKFDTCFRAFAVRNDGAADIYISKTSGIVPDADGVMCVKSGGSAVFAHMDIYADTVYLLGNGRVQVHAQNDSANPFNFAPTFDGGVMAEGNPVVMDNLQGGVPFSEIVVSGKNLIPPDYMTKSGTYNGVTVTVKDDGRFDISGTATSEGYILEILMNYPLIGGKKYTFNCSKQYDVNTFNLGFTIKDKNGNWKYGLKSYPATIIADEGDYISAWRLWAYNGVEYSAENVEIQMEIGDTATAYEPPITGRELTVNVNGTDYTITPTSNPYIIPNDIRQVDGLNVVTVSEGELSVTGVRKNAAVKKIWDKIDELTTAIIVSNGETIE